MCGSFAARALRGRVAGFKGSERFLVPLVATQAIADGGVNDELVRVSELRAETAANFQRVYGVNMHAR